MSAWEITKEKFDPFMTEVKARLASQVASMPSLADDQLRATDLIVLAARGPRGKDLRIAVRLRDAQKYLPSLYGRGHLLPDFFNEATLRSSRPRQPIVELQKIERGWAHIFFYGFVDHKTGCLVMWTILDLDAFRVRLKRRRNGKADPPHYELQHNKDKSSDFRGYSLESLGSSVVREYVWADPRRAPQGAHRLARILGLGPLIAPWVYQPPLPRPHAARVITPAARLIVPRPPTARRLITPRP